MVFEHIKKIWDMQNKNHHKIRNNNKIKINSQEDFSYPSHNIPHQRKNIFTLKFINN